MSTLRFALICTIFLFILGGLNHLARKNRDEVSDLIAGKHGDIKMIVVAASMPGPAGAKQLCDEFKSGKNRGNVIVSLTAMMVLGITMLVFRGPLLEGELLLIWLVIGSCMLFQVWFVCKILKPWL